MDSFIKSYNEESYGGYFFEIDIQYPENLHDLEEAERLVTDLHDKTEYVFI